MSTNEKSKIIATVGTAIVMFLLFLLLWFVYLGAPVVPEDEGIEVALGNAEEGGGYESMENPMSAPSTSAPAASTPSNNDILTQEDESLVVPPTVEDEKRKAEAEALRRQQREAAERAEAERIAKEKALAEQRAKEQAAIDKANAFGSLFGTNGSEATGSGNSTGNSQKGNPVGHGSSGGNSWSLAGRSCKGIPKPSTNFQQEGVVVVDIQVNAAGDVVSAKVGNGTNISDKTTQQIALDAARKAKFSEGTNSIQIGTITYTFKFN